MVSGPNGMPQSAGKSCLIVSLNAQNIHKAPAAWWLKAYCDAALPETPCEVLEVSVNDRPRDVLSRIRLFGDGPVCFSCYIWNIRFVEQTAKALRALEPERVIVLGGPEVSFEEGTERFPFADYIIKGQGEAVFADLITKLLSHDPPSRGVLEGVNEDFSSYPSPYTDEYFSSFSGANSLPIENQLLYYESSRGCPFNCSYCLSSASRGVTYLPLPRVTAELELLLEKGAKNIKFVDRTFNSNASRAASILRFLLWKKTDCTFHFEAAADLFTEELFELISAMPPGKIQFEIGIQTLNASVLDNIRRTTDTGQVLRNIRRLVAMGNCHVHADLIAGLPGEDMSSFICSFNAAIDSRVHMLQLGFLKMLKGAAISSVSLYPGYVVEEYPPYEILCSDAMSFEDLAALHWVEQALNRYYNSGMFRNTLSFVFDEAGLTPFAFFHSLREYLDRDSLWRTDMRRTYEVLYEFLLYKGHGKVDAAEMIRADCSAFHPRSVLPRCIDGQEDRALENRVRAICCKENSSLRNIRAVNIGERFGTRVYFYDIRDPVTREYYSLPAGDGFYENLRQLISSRMEKS